MFQLGQVVATPGALEALSDANTLPITLLRRHIRGDWGDLTTHDKEANAWALKNEARILSAYVLPSGVKVWIITEAGRHATTLLLPDEY